MASLVLDELGVPAVLAEMGDVGAAKRMQIETVGQIQIVVIHLMKREDFTGKPPYSIRAYSSGAAERGVWRQFGNLTAARSVRMHSSWSWRREIPGLSIQSSIAV